MMNQKLSYAILIFLSVSALQAQNLFLDTDVLSGEDIELTELHFVADSSEIEQRSFAMLDELVRFLEMNPMLDVEIKGHTNTIPSHQYCDWLSQTRADAAKDYLIEKGISEDRLIAKGYGKRLPKTSDHDQFGREQNQRVEIRFEQ